MHDGVPVDQRIEHAQFERMHDVLRIMQHDRLGPPPRLGIAAAQRVPERVEAIGLGRRPVMGPDHHRDPRIACRRCSSRIDRRAVVRIGADIDPVIFMLESRDRGREHRPDHRHLVPRGHEYRERRAHQGRGKIAQTRTDGPTTPDRSTDEDEIDQQIV